MKPRKSAPFRSYSSLVTVFTAALFTHFAAPSASAITYYWDNDGATAGFGIAAGTWAAPTTGSATEGWSQDGTGATEPVSVTTTTGDTLNFGNAATGLATGSIAVSGTVIANKLTFATGSGAITLSGGTIALGGTAPSITINKGGQTIGSALTLNANTSIVVGSSGLGMADFNGAIGGTGNLTITTGSAVNGSTGTNTGIDLGGASTYTGTTLITAGDNDNVMNVRAFVDNALPATTVLTLSGGTAGAGSGRQISYDLVGNNQTLAGLTNVTLSARPQRILNSTGTATLTINNTSPASSSFGGNINGTGLSLAKTGTGTQILRGGNTLTGTTTISGGKLIGVVDGNCASSKVIIGNTLGTFGVSITDNTKTWTCKELAPTAAGTLEFDFGAIAPSETVSPLTITVPTLLTGLANFTAATPKVKVNVDTGLPAGTYPLMTWDIVSGTVPSTADLTVSTLLAQTVPSLVVSGNTLNLVITSTAVTFVKAQNTLNLSDPNSWVGGVAPGTTGLATWNSTVTSANTTSLGADITWSGIVIADPTGSVTINGANTLTLGAAAVDIDMSAATADLALNCPLTLGDANIWDVAATRTLTLGGPVSGAFGVTKLGAGTLQLGASNIMPDGVGSGNLSLTGTLDLKGNSDTINGLSGSGIIDNTGLATSTFSVGANDQTSTFTGVIQNSSGTLNLTKIGSGTLNLGGANTLSGAVTISGGALSVNNIAPLDNVTGITMADGTTLRTNVNDAVVNAPIVLGAVGTTATINASNFDGSGSTLVPFTLGGAISGGANLTLSGIEATNSYGLIILDAASSYTGSTFITTVSGFAGGPPDNANIFVRLGIENALPTTTVVTLDGGDGGGGGRFCELNLNGNNQTLAGLTNVTGRLLRSQEVYNTNATTCTLTINNTTPAASTYAGKIGGQLGPAGASGDNLGLTKSGSGTFTISGANTYTGATTITGGTLALGALNTLPNASSVLIGAATLNAATTGTETAGTLGVTGAAAINLASGAVLAFLDSSSLTWSGTLNITGSFVSGASIRFGDGTGTGLTPAQIASISASGFTGFALNGTGYLTATSTGGFSSWITGTFANGTVPGDKQGPNQDFDNDGISNLVEYGVAGEDPTVSKASIGNFNGTLLSFTKRAGTSGLTYAIQDSTDLGIADAWVEVTGGSYVNDAETISFTLTPGTPVKNFLRLQVLSN